MDDRGEKRKKKIMKRFTAILMSATSVSVSVSALPITGTTHTRCCRRRMHDISRGRKLKGKQQEEKSQE